MGHRKRNIMFNSMSDNAKGAVLMMAAMASFACSDAAVKNLLEFLPFDQVHARTIGWISERYRRDIGNTGEISKRYYRGDLR